MHDRRRASTMSLRHAHRAMRSMPSAHRSETAIRLLRAAAQMHIRTMAIS